MNEFTLISNSEWEIMKVVWQTSPITANQIIDSLQEIISWKPKTIKTLINRLVKKKVLDFRKEGREYWYIPLVDEKTCVREESRSFLMRVFGGALQPMLVHFIENENLSPKEIQELKHLLNKKGD